MNGPEIVWPSFADTCFLLTLIGVDRHPDENEYERQKKLEAEIWWQHVVLRARASGEPATCYWSPIVFEEIVWVTALVVAQRPELHDEFGVKTLINELSADGTYNPRQPSPKFVAAIVQPLLKRLQQFMQYLTTTNDVWSAPDQTGDTTVHLSEVLSWGSLKPADCLGVLAAANAGAKTFFTHDSEFRSAAKKLDQHFGMRVTCSPRRLHGRHVDGVRSLVNDEIRKKGASIPEIIGSQVLVPLLVSISAAALYDLLKGRDLQTLDVPQIEMLIEELKGREIDFQEIRFHEECRSSITIVLDPLGFSAQEIQAIYSKTVRYFHTRG